jgi:hypothetical protein
VPIMSNCPQSANRSSKKSVNNELRRASGRSCIVSQRQARHNSLFSIVLCSFRETTDGRFDSPLDFGRERAVTFCMDRSGIVWA